MSYTNPTVNSTSARFLAVLALVFLLGAQVLEASHNHSPSDSVTTSCVLSHSGIGAALPATIPTTPAIVAASVPLLSLRTQAKINAVSSAYLPRGPPGNT